MNRRYLWPARRTTQLWLFVCAAMYVALSGCDSSSPSDSIAGKVANDDPHAWMVAELERIAMTTPPSANAFLNEARAEEARRGVEAATTGEERMFASIQLGIELLLSGQTESAIQQLQTVEEIIKPVRQRFDRASLITLDELLLAAFMRLGEQQNCLVNHTADSCLIPISGAGVHSLQAGSRAALTHVWPLMRNDPENVKYRWIFNLAHMTVGQYPDKVPKAKLIPPTVFESEHPLPRLFDRAPALGVDVPELSGGVVLEDLDRDGDLDILCSSWGLSDQLRYFENDGKGQFHDKTAQANLTGIVSGLNLIHADYNNDGFADVLVLRGAWLRSSGRHPNSLLRNNGDGTFTDVTKPAGLLSYHPTQTGAWGDFDGDGWLDLFVGNESMPNEIHPCQLYRNNGDGTFSDIAAEVGLDTLAYVKGVAWGDFNNDNRPDLYLSCFEGDNLLFRNDGSSRDGWWFTDVTLRARVAEPLISFPTWFFDYDNDGWLDLFVGNFISFADPSLEPVVRDYLGLPVDAPRTKLYRNRGDGTFEDVSGKVGLNRVMLPMGANFGDVDNDGWLDMYIGTGQPDLLTLVPNRMYRNDAGRRFQNVTTAAGVGHIQKGHGIAFGDIDNDGDQDIYAVMGGAYSGDVYGNALFENPGNDNRWITLILDGVTSNRSAIGTRIRVALDTVDGARDIYVTVGTGGSFGSSSLQQEIGLADATAITAIEVAWPATGAILTFEDVAMDRVYLIREEQSTLVPQDRKPFTLSGTHAGHDLSHQGDDHD